MASAACPLCGNAFAEKHQLRGPGGRSASRVSCQPCGGIFDITDAAFRECPLSMAELHRLRELITAGPQPIEITYESILTVRRPTSGSASFE